MTLEDNDFKKVSVMTGYSVKDLKRIYSAYWYAVNEAMRSYDIYKEEIVPGGKYNVFLTGLGKLKLNIRKLQKIKNGKILYTESKED